MTDLDYADDLALLSDTIDKAQSLLCDLEIAASAVGLHDNASKMEFVVVNMDTVINSLNGSALKHIHGPSNILVPIISQTAGRTFKPEKAWPELPVTSCKIFSVLKLKFLIKV